jgi:hypothetical protein
MIFSKKYLLYALCFLVLLFAFITGQTFAAEQEGVIKGNVTTQGEPMDQATRSQADLYDLKAVNGTDDATNIVISSKWGTTKTYLAKWIWNNSATAVVVKVRFANGGVPGANDTIRIKIPAYSWTMKLPKIHTIYKLGATDTLLLPVQVD